jgi:hypothetical protein
MVCSKSPDYYILWAYHELNLTDSVPRLARKDARFNRASTREKKCNTLLFYKL